MTEPQIGNLIALNGLALVLSCWLYQFGGRFGTSKLWRRLGSALVLALAVNITAFLLGKHHLPYLLLLPCLFAGFSMGYGANTFQQRLIRRILYAIGVLGSGLIIALTLGDSAWWIFMFHCGIGIWSVWAGLTNPWDAPAEEFIICLLLNLGLISYPFLR